jgi:hypothetical protein
MDPFKFCVSHPYPVSSRPGDSGNFSLAWVKLNNNEVFLDHRASVNIQFEEDAVHVG